VTIRLDGGTPIIREASPYASSLVVERLQVGTYVIEVQAFNNNPLLSQPVSKIVRITSGSRAPSNPDSGGGSVPPRGHPIEVLDQDVESAGGNGGHSTWWGSDNAGVVTRSRQGQTFTAGKTGLLTKVAFRADRNTACRIVADPCDGRDLIPYSGPLTVEIRTLSRLISGTCPDGANSCDPLGDVLASTSYDPPVVRTEDGYLMDGTLQWSEVSFPTPAHIDGGTQYTIMWSTDSPGGTAADPHGWMLGSVSESQPYAGGDAWAFIGDELAGRDQEADGVPDDFQFKTWVLTP
jgi:hypothetical protein